MSRINLKRHRKAGSTRDALLIAWRGLKAAEEALYASAETNDLGLVLKAVHAITQASGTYAKLIETAELEARIEALEEAAQKSPMRKVA